MKKRAIEKSLMLEMNNLEPFPFEPKREEVLDLVKTIELNGTDNTFYLLKDDILKEVDYNSNKLKGFLVDNATEFNIDEEDISELKNEDLSNDEVKGFFVSKLSKLDLKKDFKNKTEEYIGFEMMGNKINIAFAPHLKDRMEEVKTDFFRDVATKDFVPLINENLEKIIDEKKNVSDGKSEITLDDFDELREELLNKKIETKLPKNDINIKRDSFKDEYLTFLEENKDEFSIKVEDNGENRYCLADKDFSLNKLLMYAMDEKFADTLRITTDVKYENELELQNNKEYSLVSLDKLKEENEKLIEKVDVKMFKESDSSLDKITNKVITNTIKNSIEDINTGKSENILKELKENYEKDFQNQLEKIEDKNSLIEKNAKKFDLTLGDNGKIQEFDTGDKEEYDEMINQVINSYRENNFLEFLDEFEMSKGQKELEDLDKSKSNKNLNLETLKDLRNEHLGSKEYNDDLIKIKAFTTAIVLGDEEKLSIDEINKVFNSEKLEDLHIQERTLEKVNEYIEKRSDNIEKFDFIDNKNLLDFKGVYDFQDNTKTKEELSFYKSEKELITEKSLKEKEFEKDNRKEQIEKTNKKEVEKDEKENEREINFF